MHEGHCESRRTLALDVWRLCTDKKFNAGDYIRTGEVQAMRSLRDCDIPADVIALGQAELERLKAEARNG